MRMELSHKEKLKEHLPEITQRVNPQHLLPYLRCLPEPCKEEIETCQRMQSRTLAVSVLHGHLIKRPAGFSQFVEALRDPAIDMVDLADKLDPPEAATLSRSSFSDNTRTGLVRSSASQTTYSLDTPLPELSAKVCKTMKKADSGNTLMTPEDLDGESGSGRDETSPVRNVQNQSQRSHVMVSEEDYNSLKHPVEDDLRVTCRNGHHPQKLRSSHSKDLEQNVMSKNPISDEIRNSNARKMQDSIRQSAEDDWAKTRKFRGCTTNENLVKDNVDESLITKTELLSPNTLSQDQLVGTAAITELAKEAEFSNLDGESTEFKNKNSRLDECSPEKDLIKLHEAAEFESSKDPLVKEDQPDIPKEDEENQPPVDIAAGMNNVNQPFSIKQNERLFGKSTSADYAPNIACDIDIPSQEFKRRQFEEKLENANPGTILLSTTMLTLSSKVSSADQVSQEFFHLENYSLEDAKAQEAKGPSMSRELLSIERKKDKHLPGFDLLLTKTEELSAGSNEKESQGDYTSFDLETIDLAADEESVVSQLKTDYMSKQHELPHEDGGEIPQKNEENVKRNAGSDKEDPDRFISLDQRDRSVNESDNSTNKQGILQKDAKETTSTNVERDLTMQPEVAAGELPDRGPQVCLLELSSRGLQGEQNEQSDRGLQDSESELASRGPQNIHTEQSNNVPLDGMSAWTAKSLLDSLRERSEALRHTIFTVAKISYDSFI